jgi:hypothetical protein
MSDDFRRAAAAFGRLGGLAKSAKKAEAARENGKKGGWPKGRKRKPDKPPAGRKEIALSKNKHPSRVPKDGQKGSK